MANLTYWGKYYLYLRNIYYILLYILINDELHSLLIINMVYPRLDFQPFEGVRISDPPPNILVCAKERGRTKQLEIEPRFIHVMGIWIMIFYSCFS